MNAASFIEYSCLRSTTTLADVELVCIEALEYKFAAVCVPPMFVKKAKALTDGNNIQVATVIGFPFGYNAIEAKLAETVLAIVDGADELDVMINLVALKNKDWQYLAKEINTILTVIRKSERKIKVIIEAGLLNEEEIIACCDIYGAAGVDFLQTATGYGGQTVSIEKLLLMRKHLADAIQLKLGDVVKYPRKDWITAGANRIVIHSLEDLVKVNDGMIFENEQDYKN